jgi:APA family basic amino acid/polyamine antiporter
VQEHLMTNPAGRTVTAAAAPATALDTEFRRGLGLYDATMVVIGSMIGSGIFIVSADMARSIGSAGWLLAAWALTGMLTIVGALSYGELAAMMPRAGGQYVYLREAFSPIWRARSRRWPSPSPAFPACWCRGSARRTI